MNELLQTGSTCEAAATFEPRIWFVLKSDLIVGNCLSFLRRQTGKEERKVTFDLASQSMSSVFRKESPSRYSRENTTVKGATVN